MVIPYRVSDPLPRSPPAQGMTSTPLSRVRPRTLQAQQAAAEEEADDVQAPGAGGSSVQTVSGPDESATVRPQLTPQVRVEGSGDCHLVGVMGEAGVGVD